MNTSLSGPELIASVTQDPANLTLDAVLARDPGSHDLSDGNIVSLVKTLRAERAAIEVKAEKAKAKKQGVDDEKVVSDTDESD